MAQRRIIVEDAEPETEEPETEETEEEETPKPAAKEKPERRERKQTPVTEESESEYVECPECDAQIKRERLGNHRFKAHKIDRRQADRDKPEGDIDLKAPEKVTSKDQGKATGKKKKTGVSSAWFGDRAE